MSKALGENTACMDLLVILLFLALLFGGIGFAWHALWWVAAIVVVLLLVSFLARAFGSGSRYR